MFDLCSNVKYKEINMGQVIFSAMMKECCIEGHKYEFKGLLTQYLRRHRVEKGELDYRPMVDSSLINVTTSRSIAGAQGPIYSRPSIKLD